MRRYLRRDLMRNPRRTLASLTGVALGVGLFSGVLFFIDASAASMTKRAIAPLALDMQRVLSSPLGRGLALTEHLSKQGPLAAGEAVGVTLTLANRGSAAADEVVVNDEPPPPLAYEPGTTAIDGSPVPDVAGRTPLAQGEARSGLNIGAVPAGETVVLTYTARATHPVPSAQALAPTATVSSRAEVVPVRANAPDQVGLAHLTAAISRIPGVVAADALSFVDLPPGSLHAGDRTVPGPVRVFAFDRSYQDHYPSIRIEAGAWGPGSALLSAEAARTLGAGPGATIRLDLPGGATPITTQVGGVADLARAKPLFYSRKSSKFEDFVYVPASVVVPPGAFQEVLIPAFRARGAERGNVIRNEPVLEVDVLVDRSRLHTDPGRALAQTRSVAASVQAVAPWQDHLIDNISNTLEVARDDAAAGKRMFFFLGLPGLVLAAILAAYAGSIHADAQRREQATLRMHGAHRPLLLRALFGRALALSGLGAVLGTASGWLSVLVVLGRDTLAEAPAADLATSALAAAGLGMSTTLLALYIPGRRSLARTVAEERMTISRSPDPAWRRLRLDVALVLVALVAEGLAVKAGAFDAPVTSVSAGEAVSLHPHLLIAPLLAWLGGTLLSVRLFGALISRLPIPPSPQFGPIVSGTLVRSLRRRPRDLAKGTAGVGLVIAFGVSLALFAATYDEGKAADARFVVGSDLRITPSVVSSRSHPREFASDLLVDGVRSVTPVVAGLDNSVLIGPYDQNSRDLAAIDPEGFARATPLSDSFFGGEPAADVLGRIAADPNGVLLEEETAGDLSIRIGDDVQVLFARGTKNQTLQTLHVAGFFERLPGFPQGVHAVVNLARYQNATGLRDVDFLLADTTEGGPAGLARAVSALEAGPGAVDPMHVDTTETALDRDQSSLTALNVNGLVDLDRLYTLLMSAAAIAIFVFGLMLQRRREYVLLRSQGMQTGQLRVLVLAEAALVALGGLASGLVAGTGMGYLLVHILRPLFILDPPLTFPVPGLSGLTAVALTATLASALAGTSLLRRFRPNELLREA